MRVSNACAWVFSTFLPSSAIHLTCKLSKMSRRQQNLHTILFLYQLHSALATNAAKLNTPIEGLYTYGTCKCIERERESIICPPVLCDDFLDKSSSFSFTARPDARESTWLFDIKQQRKMRHSVNTFT